MNIVDRTEERVCPLCYMSDRDRGSAPEVMERWEEYHDNACAGRWWDESAEVAP